MKFLCLHGASTNDQIFEIQTGGLRQQLEKAGHTFTFINGKLDAKVEEELEGVVDGPFFDHYPRDPILPGSQLTEAFDHTNHLIAEQGPFDAVLGFSQGAALAASLIAHHNELHPGAAPLFRVAVFLCGANPWATSGLERMSRVNGAYPITIPTAHVVGALDHVYPQSMQLYALCEPAKAAFYDHGSKHMVPFDMKNTDEIVRVIEETIAKA
ncbi:hypothetical protein N7495_007551 [Penicillium taxi]|uniref:uncharacterized protein n=1 Tax=Penicillium taxi TaxID=168475 RepID=UPI00254571EB|nr:uncharacterized protein N7495_007551 [Penicillium taxi]KAJ5887510.1 hypothetical protein N7495_007551 [Penicillium taxi]